MDLGPFRAAVKKRMEERGLNQSDVARLLEGEPAFPTFGTAQKWLSKFMLGGIDPPALPLLSVCKVLGIPLEEIGLPEPPKTYRQDPEIRFRKIREQPDSAYGELSETIPVIAFGSAGDGNTQFTDQGYPTGAGMYQIERPLDLSDPNAFGVEVEGDSMEDRFYAGEVVVVDTRKRPSNGDFAVVGLVTHERLIKRWRKSGARIYLESINPAYAPIVVSVGAIRFAYKIVWSKAK